MLQTHCRIFFQWPNRHHLWRKRQEIRPGFSVDGNTRISSFFPGMGKWLLETLPRRLNIVSCSWLITNLRGCNPIIDSICSSRYVDAKKVLYRLYYVCDYCISSFEHCHKCRSWAALDCCIWRRFEKPLGDEDPPRQSDGSRPEESAWHFGGVQDHPKRSLAPLPWERGLVGGRRELTAGVLGRIQTPLPATTRPSKALQARLSCQALEQPPALTVPVSTSARCDASGRHKAPWLLSLWPKAGISSWSFVFSLLLKNDRFHYSIFLSKSCIMQPTLNLTNCSSKPTTWHLNLHRIPLKERKRERAVRKNTPWNKWTIKCRVLRKVCSILSHDLEVTLDRRR